MTKKQRVQKQRKDRPQRRRARPLSAGRHHEVEYPIGTVAYYGPDDKTVTKIAAGVITSEDAKPILKRWRGPGVVNNPEVAAELTAFFESYGVRQVAMTDGVLGCPHEEGIDFPEGQECPYCPFWRGKQGIRVR